MSGCTDVTEGEREGLRQRVVQGDTTPEDRKLIKRGRQANGATGGGTLAPYCTALCTAPAVSLSQPLVCGTYYRPEPEPEPEP